MEKEIFKLSRPVVFENKVYEELVVDYGCLTGKDVREAKRHFERPGRVSIVLSLDPEFASYMVAKALKVPYEMMDYLPAADYLAITQAMVNFLLVSGFSKEDALAMKEAKQKAEPLIN